MGLSKPQEATGKTGGLGGGGAATGTDCRFNRRLKRAWCNPTNHALGEARHKLRTLPARFYGSRCPAGAPRGVSPFLQQASRVLNHRCQVPSAAKEEAGEANET